MSDNSVAYMERFNEFKKKLKGSSLEKMQKATQAVRTETLKTFQGNRSGRVYRVPGTKKTYIASSPGEAPASATGTLRQHIRTEITVEGRAIVGGVGTDVKYGPWLEFGTVNILPRPWLRPSFERAEEEVKKILGESIT